MTSEPKPAQQRDMSCQFIESELCSFDDIFPGFSAWYRAHYDEQGKRRADAPELFPGLGKRKEQRNGE